jgi:deazaflavin-dependent oxidoreductase (nitroreductase family)
MTTTPDFASWNRAVIEEFRANDGRVGGQFDGADMILIHHVGARSGQVRVNPLVYFPDGDRMIIVASKGGSPEHPAWYHNLKANPKITVEVGTESFPVAVTEITCAEREALWARIIEERPGFAEYQRNTTRVIPLLALTRTDAP